MIENTFNLSKSIDLLENNIKVKSTSRWTQLDWLFVDKTSVSNLVTII